METTTKTPTKKIKLVRLTTDECYGLKKGMKVRLVEDDYESKAGDIVKITQAINPGSDYEIIRISNGQASWRVSSSDLAKV